MSSDILFDNILITDQNDVADSWAAQTFDLKHDIITKEAVSNELIKISFVLGA